MWADLVRELGRTPFGVDLSIGMLGYAKNRLSVVRADAAHLPFASSTVPAAIPAARLSVRVSTAVPRIVAQVAAHQVSWVADPTGAQIADGLPSWRNASTA